MNKIKCELCNGNGIIKNINYKCDFCDGSKCIHMPPSYIYKPFKECKACINKKFINNESCNICKGTGFIKNNIIKCKFCQIDHKWCGCILNINPYIECIKCYGTGEIIN